MEDQSPFLEATFFGPWLAAAVAGQVAADRPDVVVVDYLMRSAQCEVEAHGVPLVVLVHMAHRCHAGLGGATYMHQEATLRRILGALDGLGVRVLLLTGSSSPWSRARPLGRYARR
jgi:hypothetical protein